MDLFLVKDTILPLQYPPTYGLRSDPVALMTLLFASLVHDVEHTGVTNRQRAQEEDELALLYNDQSIHEQRSLRLAFGELLKDEYSDWRSILFPDPEEDYRFFRAIVIDAVLSTDIASPERAQLSRSRWTEAFGGMKMDVVRRSSIVSNISLPRARGPVAIPTNRRGSNASINSFVSDVTTDSYAMMKKQQKVDAYNARFKQMRRMSNQSTQSWDSYHSDFANDSLALQVKKPATDDDSLCSFGSGLAPDSVAFMMQKRTRRRSSVGNGQGVVKRRNSLGSTGLPADVQGRFRRRNSTGTRSSNEGFHSITEDSIGIQQKRYEGQGATRRKNGSGWDGDEVEVFQSYDDDDSLSLTPPSSGDEYDGVVMSGVTLSNYADELTSALASPTNGFLASPTKRFLASPTNGNVVRPIAYRRTKSAEESAQDPEQALPVSRKVHRSSSMDLATLNTRKARGIVPGRRGSTGMGRRGSTGHVNSRFTRRASTGTTTITRLSPLRGAIQEEPGQEPPLASPRQRLGIRRSMDLSGESIVTYSRRSSVGAASTLSQESADTVDYDEPDPMRSAVIIELLLKAADVAHSLQGWETYIKWSDRMFMELAAAHADDRGHDPAATWFENQTMIMENYLLPLARKLNDIGIFGETFGPAFADIVEDNFDQWLLDGFELSGELEKVAKAKYEEKKAMYFL